MNRSLRAAMLAGWLAIAAVVGCQSPNIPPATRPSNTPLLGERAQQHATELMAEAKAELRAGNRESAMQLLKEAIGIDRTNGTAQHMLGKIYFEKGDLYNAALHLDTASRLLSDRFEPCYNLGRVLEAGGEYEQAMRSYRRSLSRRVDHLESMENLARVRIKAGYRDDETLRLLTRCLDHEQRPEWRAWLKQEAEQLQDGLSQKGTKLTWLPEKSSAQTQHAD